MSNNIDKRTFIAISLSKQHTNLLVNLQQHLRVHVDEDAIAVNKVNLHLTIAFLGPTTEQQIQHIDKFIQHQNFRAFEQTLNQLSWWPTSKVTCLEGEPTTQIIHIASSLKKMASQIKLYQSHHSFRPHVSLFRSVKQVKNELNHLTLPTEPICIRANELTLYESTNSSLEVTYTPLQSWTLQT